MHAAKRPTRTVGRVVVDKAAPPRGLYSSSHSGAATPEVSAVPLPARSTTREVATNRWGRFRDEVDGDGLTLTDGDKLGRPGPVHAPVDGVGVLLADTMGGSNGARNEDPGEAS